MSSCANQTSRSGSSSSLLPHKNGIRAFKGTLELMSELYFASVEPGDNFTTEPIILNTALYYALGYAKGNYINFPAKRVVVQ
jgi:CRISPR-associated protein Csc1